MLCQWMVKTIFSWKLFCVVSLMSSCVLKAYEMTNILNVFFASHLNASTILLLCIL